MKTRNKTIRNRKSRNRKRRTRNLKGGWWKFWNSCDKYNEIIDEYLILKNKIHPFSKDKSIHIINFLINPNDNDETDFKDELNDVFNLN
jgi:hypothetical protein